MIRRVSLADYIEQNDMVDGLRTGLWLPRKRPEVYSSVATAIKILDLETIKRLIASPERTPAIERFPAKVWIRNQGRRGSCAGYAAAGALSRCRVASGLPFQMLSGEFIYSMCNGGRDMGSPTELTWQKIEEVGAAPEELVQHESYLWRQMSEAARKAAARFKAWECFRIDSALEMASALLANFFIVAVVHASRGYRSVDARGVRGRSAGRGNHAIGVQDVRLSPDGQLEFNEVGSWGLQNGVDGYAWLTWGGHFDSTVQGHAFYAISNTSGDLSLAV
jgi:hypothetical protein